MAKTNKQKALITGIGGSIGAHVMAHIFANTDWDIVGIDSFRHKGLTDRVSMFTRNHPEWKERLQIFTHDLAAPISPPLKEKIGNPDYIINLAAISDVDASIEDPAYCIMNNTAIAVNMLDYARFQKPKVFMQISTDEVYGPAPIGEKHKEWSTILPSNPYSASKACQEAAAIAYWRSYGVPLILINTMNNFGEAQQPSKFPAMIQSKLEKGEKVIIHGREEEIGSRHYIHSRNFADALLYILRKAEPYMHQDGHIDKPDRYNVVGEVELDNLELAQLIAELMGRKLEYELVDFHKARPGHDRRYALDGKKMEFLGWSPPVPFRHSLEETIAWQQRHPEWLA